MFDNKSYFFPPHSARKTPERALQSDCLIAVINKHKKTILVDFMLRAILRLSAAVA